VWTVCVGPENLRQVLTTVVDAAVQLTDPVTQKLCFAILRKLVEVWGLSHLLLILMLEIYYSQ